jgi:hypothetical protein
MGKGEKVSENQNFTAVETGKPTVIVIAFDRS